MNKYRFYYQSTQIENLFISKKLLIDRINHINSNVKGKTLVLTTTNGTKAIHKAKDHKVITASFINIDIICVRSWFHYKL